jgi:hypothetical protein
MAKKDDARQAAFDEMTDALTPAFKKWTGAPRTDQAQMAGYLEAVAKFVAGGLYAQVANNRDIARIHAGVLTIGIIDNVDDAHRAVEAAKAEREADAREG